MSDVESKEPVAEPTREIIPIEAATLRVLLQLVEKNASLVADLGELQLKVHVKSQELQEHRQRQYDCYRQTLAGHGVEYGEIRPHDGVIVAIRRGDG